jgi:hypothetical protein
MNITGTDRTASYFDIHIEIDSEGLQRTKLYDKEMISISIFHIGVTIFLTNKEQVGEKMGTFVTQRNVDCLLQNTR